MNENKNEEWITSWGGVLLLHTPAVSANIEYEKDGYYVTLYARNIIESGRSFDDLEEAKEYAVRLMRKMLNQSLPTVNNSLQANHERASN